MARGQRGRLHLPTVLLLAVVLHGGLLGVATAHKGESHGRGKPPWQRREIYQRSPRLDLVTQDGTPFSLENIRGKVVLVTFAYTSCPVVCPVLTAKLVAIQRKLKKRNLDSSVHLLMITVDPEIDTPPVLKEYAQRHDADLASWSFLTGSRSALERAWNDFGVVPVRRAKGDIYHMAMTVLLDPQTRQQLQYLGFGWLEEDVIRDIKALVEAGSRSHETPPETVALKYAQVISQARTGGTLEVRVKDHREAIGDFFKVEITVDSVRLSPKAGWKFWQVGWKDLNSSRERIDLTQFTGKHAATVFKGEIESGVFDAIHIKIREIKAILKKDRSLVEVKNVVTPIKLLFSIREKEETVIVLDLVVLDLSDHPPKGYELHIKGYELYTDGKLIDKIPPG